MAEQRDIHINMGSAEAVQLPSTRMYLRNVPGKGRGVYAGERIPARTLINVSPVLLFPEQRAEHEEGSCTCCRERAGTSDSLSGADHSAGTTTGTDSTATGATDTITTSSGTTSSGSSSGNGSGGETSVCSCSSSHCPERDILAHYTYSFGADTQALALGMGSMFNHAKNNNVGFVLDKTNLLIRYTTVKEVAEDSELLINYGNRLWFVDESEGCDSSSDDEDDPFARMEL